MEKLRAIFFDVGETLIDETRLMHIWADALGVDRSEFLDVLDDVIFRNEPIRQVFERLRPGFDIAAARAQRRRDGTDFFIEARDLYADAKPCLSALRQRGLFVGIAGNQPPTAKAALESFASMPTSSPHRPNSASTSLRSISIARPLHCPSSSLPRCSMSGTVSTTTSFRHAVLA